MSLIPTIKPLLDGEPSKEFFALYGIYNFTDDAWAIPYFSLTMTLHEALENLKFTTDLPGMESVGWQVEELFQRNIDWNRVQHQIVRYLRANEVPHFFSALTVAVLPALNGQRVDDFTDPRLRAPNLDEYRDLKEQIQAGPLCAGFLHGSPLVSPGASNLSVIRWNKTQTYCVAIDGQHRLAGIRELHRATMNSGNTALHQTRVPVILLPLAPQLGFKTPEEDKNLTPVLRRIFIDLNRYAKVPSRARLVLLDDHDPGWVCVRRVIGTHLSMHFSELDSLDPTRLPLSLVDWHSEGIKFEKGPYLTTVLSLDWIVTNLLGLKEVKDYSDLPNVQSKLLSPIENSLDFHFPTSTYERLGKLEKEGEERPFTFHKDELQEITEHFESLWCPAIVHLLTQFQPYKEIIDLRREAQLDTVAFANWYETYSKTIEKKGSGAKVHAQGELERIENGLTIQEMDFSKWRDTLEQIEEYKQLNGDLAFYNVFQRALFWTLRDLLVLDIWTLERGGHQSKVYGAARALTRHLNRLYKQSCGNLYKLRFDREDLDFKVTRRFWAGASLNQNDGVDSTLGAVKRISDWISLGALLCTLAEEEPYLCELDIVDLIDDIREESAANNKVRQKARVILKRIRDVDIYNPQHRDRSSVARSVFWQEPLEHEIEEKLDIEFLLRADCLWSFARGQ